MLTLSSHTAFTVIKVEPTVNPNGGDDVGNADNNNRNDEESMDVEYVSTSAKVSGENDVGRGVARVMFGKSIFRGTIMKVCPLFSLLPFTIIRLDYSHLNLEFCSTRTPTRTQANHPVVPFTPNTPMEPC